MLFVKFQSYNHALFDKYFSEYVTAFRKLLCADSTSIHHPFCIFYPTTVIIKTKQTTSLLTGEAEPALETICDVILEMGERLKWMN